MTHKTKGIVLRTIKYGDTSIIVQIFTELFGVQNYIVKGVRKATSKKPSKHIYFQPAAVLELEVYHQQLKELNFIKEFNWSVLYSNIFFDVVRTAAAQYIVELLQHSLKQPENNPELFYLSESALLGIDKENNSVAANVPLWFTVQLSNVLGFGIQGKYTEATPYIDLEQGIFTSDNNDSFIIQQEEAAIIYTLKTIKQAQQIQQISLNRTIRNRLIHLMQQYISIHIQDFGELKSLAVLKQILD